MDNQGWIKIHRKLLNTSFANKPNIAWLFVVILLKANHKENKFLFNKEEVIIKPGQLLTGREELSKITGLSVMQVRYGLECLKVTSTISIKTTNKFSVITILKYSQYQSLNQQSNQPVTNKQPTSNQPVTTNNNVKNVENEETDKKDTPERHLNYLLEIPEKHIQEYIKEIGVNKDQILSKAKELHNYCSYKHKSYSNYKLFLWNALKKDFKPAFNKYKVGVAKL